MNTNYCHIRPLARSGDWQIICNEDGRLIAAYYSREQAQRHADRLNARWSSGLPISR